MSECFYCGSHTETVKLKLHVRFARGKKAINNTVDPSKDLPPVKTGEQEPKCTMELAVAATTQVISNSETAVMKYSTMSNNNVLEIKGGG